MQAESNTGFTVSNREGNAGRLAQGRGPSAGQWQAKYLEVKEQIDRHRFGLHERYILRLVNLCSLGIGRYHATIPKLDYFVTYSKLLASVPAGSGPSARKGGVMQRGHASVAVQSVVAMQVIQIVSPGVYRFNVLFDNWRAQLLPDAAALLEQLALLEPAPDLPDELLKHFIATPSGLILPARDQGLVPISHAEREASTGADAHTGAEHGINSEPASSGKRPSDEYRTRMAGPVAPPFSVPDGSTFPVARQADCPGGVERPVTKNVTPGAKSPPRAVTENVTLAKTANNDAGLPPVTKNVTAGPVRSAERSPLASPLGTSNSLTTGTGTPDRYLITGTTYKAIAECAGNVTVAMDHALLAEVKTVIGDGARARAYWPWWYVRVRDNPEKVRLLLSVLRNESARVFVENPGGYMMGVWRNWQRSPRK